VSPLIYRVDGRHRPKGADSQANVPEKKQNVPGVPSNLAGSAPNSADPAARLARLADLSGQDLPVFLLAMSETALQTCRMCCMCCICPAFFTRFLQSESDTRKKGVQEKAITSTAGSPAHALLCVWRSNLSSSPFSCGGALNFCRHGQPARNGLQRSIADVSRVVCAVIFSDSVPVREPGLRPTVLGSVL